MKFAFFKGCKIPYFQSHYETSVKAVLNKLGVELVEIEFGCCGYPVRNQDPSAWLYTAARNLALAEDQGLDILTPCKCCFGSLAKAAHQMAVTQSSKDEVNDQLKEEGLSYGGEYRVRHLLQVLHQEVGVEAIKQQITRPFQDLKLAVHYGCHALRPSRVTAFDDPFAPTIFESLVEPTGAQCVDWERRLECCGNPLWGKNDELALRQTTNKVTDAKRSGADFLCVACTYCQIQFDTVQSEVLAGQPGFATMPSLLYPQLLGVSMGLDPQEMGLDRNLLDAKKLVNYLSPPEEAEEQPPAPAGETAAG